MADFDAIFKSIIAVIFGAIVLGQNASAMPNYAEAKRSAHKLFELFHLGLCFIEPFYFIGSVFYD